MKRSNSNTSSSEIEALKLRNAELESALKRALDVCGITELNELWSVNTTDPQYGWAHEYLIPLNVFLDKYLATPVTPEFRNRLRNIVHATFCQLVVEGKYGVKLPNEPRSIDIVEYFRKQKRAQDFNYPPCEICGESRITHYCHIIPRSEAGPDHQDNFFNLCPLHHHLFDHYRLNREEWSVLLRASEKKMKSAQLYIRTIRQKRQEFKWELSLRNPDEEAEE